MKFNKALGSPLATGPDNLTQTNADGPPVVPLIQEQKCPLRQKRLFQGASYHSMRGARNTTR